MILGFADKAWQDYLYWQENDKQVLKRINLLLKDIKRNRGDLIIVAQARFHY